MSLVSLIKGLLPNNKNSHLADDRYSLVYDSYGVNFVTDEASYHCLNKGEGGGSQLIAHVVLKMLQERDIAETIPNGFRVDSDQACLLDPEDVEVLGLPPFCSHDFDIDIQGRTTKSSFTLQLFTMLGHQKYPVKRKGPEADASGPFLLGFQRPLAFGGRGAGGQRPPASFLPITRPAADGADLRCIP